MIHKEKSIGTRGVLIMFDIAILLFDIVIVILWSIVVVRIIRDWRK